MSIFGPSHVDITSAKVVHITIDQTKDGIQVWVDVDDDGNRFRAYRIEHLEITDRRQTKPED